MRISKLTLSKVHYLPPELAPGILYVSQEYHVAGHLCACGCGNKVIVPLAPTEWSFSERMGRPSLSPSIGNWQLPCRSHYIISNGNIVWAGQWSEEQILAGRRAEELRRQEYFAARQPKKGFWQQIWDAVLTVFGQK